MTVATPPFLHPPLTDPFVVPYISRTDGELRWVIADWRPDRETGESVQHWTCTGPWCGGRTCKHIRAAKRVFDEA